MRQELCETLGTGAGGAGVTGGQAGGRGRLHRCPPTPQQQSRRTGRAGGCGGQRCLIAHPLIRRNLLLDPGARPVKGTGKGLQDTLAVPHSRLRVARRLG